MKSTLSFFKAKLCQQQQQQQQKSSQQRLPPGCASEWDEDAPPAPSSAFPINKNRRVTDGSLLTCLAADATRLTEMTSRLSRLRVWRRSRASSSCRRHAPAAAPAFAIATEGSALLPQRPQPLGEASAQPLLLRHQLRRAASEEDWTALYGHEDTGGRNRRNSISEFDEGVGCEAMGAAMAFVGPVEADVASPPADLMSFVEDESECPELMLSKTP